MNKIKWKGYTLKPLTKKEYNKLKFVSSHLVGYTNVMYGDLIDMFGEPTLGLSEDDKCQMEWVFVITDKDGNKERFYLYDWKTYDLVYTKTELSRWNIGGNSDPKILQEYIKVHKNYHWLNKNVKSNIIWKN
tara:strand:+ start:432 stop:827 length:396 start_codon:yes stop_codon:yes gene_type:complete